MSNIHYTLTLGVLIINIDVGLVEEEVDNIKVTAKNGKHHWVPAILVLFVDVGAHLRDQVLHYFNLSEVTSSVQRRPTIFI